MCAIFAGQRQALNPKTLPKGSREYEIFEEAEHLDVVVQQLLVEGLGMGVKGQEYGVEGLVFRFWGLRCGVGCRV
jgi:hypothetical protein